MIHWAQSAPRKRWNIKTFSWRPFHLYLIFFSIGKYLQLNPASPLLKWTACFRNSHQSTQVHKDGLKRLMGDRKTRRTPSFWNTISAFLAKWARPLPGPGLFLNNTPSTHSTQLRPATAKPRAPSYTVIPSLASLPEFYFWTACEHLPRLTDVETSSLQVPYDIWVQLCGKVLKHAMECSSLFS